jgi:hypothetical protein
MDWPHPFSITNFCTKTSESKISEIKTSETDQILNRYRRKWFEN